MSFFSWSSKPDRSTTSLRMRLHLEHSINKAYTCVGLDFRIAEEGFEVEEKTSDLNEPSRKSAILSWEFRSVVRISVAS